MPARAAISRFQEQFILAILPGGAKYSGHCRRPRSSPNPCKLRSLDSRGRLSPRDLIP
jgi:hypothetical protein